MAPPSEGLRELSVTVAATLLAAGLLYFLFHGKVTRFEDLALGEDTVPVFATFQGDKIHCHDMTDVADCLAAFRRRGAAAAALWLGNSQLHSINQYAAGQQTASLRLFEHLRGVGLDLVTLSQPNANLREHLVLYAYMRTKLPVRQLLLPAVFDDLRDAEVRSMVTPALADAATRDVLMESEVGRDILAAKQSTSDPDLAALDETLQERSELFLNHWLDRHVELWDLRPEVRGTIGIWIRQARNTLFGITPHSKRRLIEGEYVQNLRAAEAILADAERQGIRVVFYVAPLRWDVDLPYVDAEYERFKRDAQQLAEAHGAVYLNLEQSVPATLYGVTGSRTLGAPTEVDFMHFQASGHTILADRLAEVLDGARDGAPR